MIRKNDENGKRVRYTEDSCRAAANMLIYGILTYYNDVLDTDDDADFSELVDRHDLLEDLFNDVNGPSETRGAFRRFTRNADRAFGRAHESEAEREELTERLNAIFGELLDALDCGADGEDDDFDPDSGDGSDTEDYDDFFFGPDGKLPF